jgi:thiol-disulfide isomerase/thioredoxin
MSGKEPEKILIKAEQSSNNLNSAIFIKRDIDTKGTEKNETIEKYYISWGKEVRFQNLKYRIEDNFGTIVTYDGSIWKFKDVKNQKILFSDDMAEIASLTDELLFYVQSFLKDPNLTGDLIKGIDFKYLGEQNVENVPCDVVSYTIPKPKFFQDGDLKKKYFIGTKDGIIRKIEFEIYKDTALTETVVSYFTFSSINQDIDSNVFTLPLLDGYTEERYSQTQDEEEITLKVGEQAPDWTLLDSYGNKHSLNDYKGKIVLIDFWATWCKWCIKAIPKLQSIHQNFSNDVVVLGISCNEKKEANPVKFLKDNGGTYTVLLNGENIVDDYGITGYPTTFLIGKDGKILWSYTGYDPQLEEKIIDIINQNK